MPASGMVVEGLIRVVVMVLVMLVVLIVVHLQLAHGRTADERLEALEVDPCNWGERPC